MPTQGLTFRFNRDKAIEAILYIANRIPDPTYHSINKLLYFADKTSLERYARFITGDTYYAMEYGPVPTNAYDLMKEAPRSGDCGFRVEYERKIVPLREANLDELSDSDVECLDVVIALYKDVPVWKRTEDSHDDAWQEAWENKGDSRSHIMTVESIISQLEDSEELLEYLQSQHND